MSEEGRFRSLRVYQLSHRLGVQIHQVTLGLPKFEVYEEGSQIRRSTKRVSASIVEGYALRRYKAEYLHYLFRAYGSAEETVEHLDYLWETKSLTDESAYRALREECIDLNRQLFRFIQGVEREHDQPYSLKESAGSYQAGEPGDPDSPLNPES